MTVLSLSPYFAAFLASMRQMLRDRASAAFRSIFFVVIIVVNNAIWYSATNHGTREIQGFSHADMLWYIVFTEIAVFSTPSARIEQIGEEIANGSVEADLLRPVSVPLLRLASEFGTNAGRGFIVWIVGMLIAPVIAGEPSHYVGALLAIPSLILAVACATAATLAFASISFWIREAKATWFLFQKFIFLVGGMLFPLQFLPHWAETIAWTLPFWTMAYAPGSFSSGNADWYVLGGQLLWLVVLSSLVVLTFNAGTRRLQVKA